MNAVSPIRRTRVVHLSSVHRDHDIRIFLKECRSLARAGYDVEFIVPAERGGCRDRVTIIPVKRRQGRLARMLRGTLDVFVAGLRRRGSVYHFHDPELIPAGLLLRLLGRRVIYDVHEDVPRDIMDKPWLSYPARRLMALMAGCAEWVAARALSGVVAATPAIASRFPPQCTVIARNLPLTSEIMLVRSKAPAQRSSLVYVGGISALRGAREMVQVMGRLSKFPEARLILVGEIDSNDLTRDLEVLPGWNRVDYLGWQDRAAVQRVVTEAAAGLVLFHGIPNAIASQPNKLFEYMAAGLAVIASDFPLWRALVVDNRCGLCVPPQDVDAIAKAIEWIFDNPAEADAMGRRGQAVVRDKMNWEREQTALLALYERLVGPPQKSLVGCL